MLVVTSSAAAAIFMLKPHSPKAAERPHQRPSERQYEGWWQERQKDAVLNSGMLFLVHDELGFDPLQPRTLVSRIFTDGDPLAFREVLPHHHAHPGDPQHRQDQPQPKQ